MSTQISVMSHTTEFDQMCQYLHSYLSVMFEEKWKKKIQLGVTKAQSEADDGGL